MILAQPISTWCTITSYVRTKLEGRAGLGPAPQRPRPGRLQDNHLLEQQTIKGDDVGPAVCGVYISLVLREKARIWATDNPSEKLYFCVVRTDSTKNTTPLELESKLYFLEHNLKNVTVPGLPSIWTDTMSKLQKKMRSMLDWLVLHILAVCDIALSPNCKLISVPIFRQICRNRNRNDMAPIQAQNTGPLPHPHCGANVPKEGCCG